MKTVGQRNTAPEMALRYELHRMGLRYRIDISPFPGISRRADIVFVGLKVAVYVDGCFWHGCPIHGTIPKHNTRWWIEKIATNKARDADTNKRLTKNGWIVLRFWEHDDPLMAARVVAGEIGKRRSN